jgi:hypothetical protein
LIVGERIAERRHLLAAVENLAGDFGRSPELVFAQTSQVRPFFAACAARSVAVGATLVAKEKRAGLLGGFGPRAGESVRWKRGESEKN